MHNPDGDSASNAKFEIVLPPNNAPVMDSLTEASTGPNLNYIWSFYGIETGSITMILNQEGSDLYGQAKYEPDDGKAWNADVVGSVTGNEVELTMTAQKDKEIIITKMTGTYADDTINGNFIQFSGGKKVGSGTFSGMWISPYKSAYTPAIIEYISKKPASRFTDVRQYTG
jgi:hypothetical protein